MEWFSWFYVLCEQEIAPLLTNKWPATNVVLESTPKSYNRHETSHKKIKETPVNLKYWPLAEVIFSPRLPCSYNAPYFWYDVPCCWIESSKKSFSWDTMSALFRQKSFRLIFIFQKVSSFPNSFNTYFSPKMRDRPETEMKDGKNETFQHFMQ